MLPFLLAIIVFSQVAAASMPPVCDVYNLSLVLCNSEINCVKHMFLDENVNDNATFNFLVNRVISNYLVTDFIDDLICNSTEGQALWMVILKSFSFCGHANEYFSAHLQTCVCRTDKVCDHKSLRDSLFIFSNSQIFIWVLTVLLIACFIPTIQEMKSIKKSLQDVKEIVHASSPPSPL